MTRAKVEVGSASSAIRTSPSTASEVAGNLFPRSRSLAVFATARFQGRFADNFQIWRTEARSATTARFVNKSGSDAGSGTVVDGVTAWLIDQPPSLFWLLLIAPTGGVPLM